MATGMNLLGCVWCMHECGETFGLFDEFEMKCVVKFNRQLGI